MSSEERQPESPHWIVFYETAVKMHEREGNWYWTRWQAFLAANSFLIALTGVLLTREPEGSALLQREGTVIGAATFGILLSLLWLWANWQTAEYRRLWADEANALEVRYCGGVGPFRNVGMALSHCRMAHVHMKFTASRITACAVPLLFISGWVAIGCGICGWQVLPFILLPTSSFLVCWWLNRHRDNPESTDDNTNTI